jgi:hypothetical protein
VVPTQRRQRYRAPDLEFFAGRTPHAAYWLGFLMADGCVTHKELIVVLHRRDEGHLRSLLAALGCTDRPLAPANGGDGFRLAIGSVRLARQLADHGIVAGRAGSLVGVARWMADSRDFWRGIVDGDGSIKFHPTLDIPCLDVVGAPGVMDQFAAFLEAAIGDGRPVVPRPHSQSSSVRMVSVAGRRALAALDALYRDAVEALPRKHDRAARAMTWQPMVRSRYPWERWGDGRQWVLRPGRDYDDANRLWEAGRRAARERGMRLVFSDDGHSARVRFVARDGSD